MSSIFALSEATPISLGAMDLGGASTQMTFIPRDTSKTPVSYMEDLTLYGEDYSVYTHSYLCYGLNEAYRQYLAHLVVVSMLTAKEQRIFSKTRVLCLEDLMHCGKDYFIHIVTCTAR